MFIADRGSIAVAALLASLPSPAAAAEPSVGSLPPQVRQKIADINYECSRAGGMPPKSPRLVTIVELTGDGRTDYVIDLSRYRCRKSESFMSGGHDGLPVWLFVGVSKHAARLAYDGFSGGVKLAAARGKYRVWLRVGALACGQPPDPNRVFAAWWSCSRPLEWNGHKKKFLLAPLSAVRDIARPKWR